MELYFTNNKRNFKLNNGPLNSHGLSAKEITNSTIPEDLNKKIHNSWLLNLNKRITLSSLIRLQSAHLAFGDALLLNQKN